MNLETLLGDRKDIKTRLCYLLEHDRREFEFIYKNRDNEEKDKHFGSIKAAILSKKLNSDNTQHKTCRGLITTTFMNARIKNHELELRGIYQHLDIADALLLEYFIDYLPKDKIAGQIGMETAIVLECVSLFFAQNLSYNAFTEQEYRLFNKRKNMVKFLLQDEPHAEPDYADITPSRILELVKSLYQRMYSTWQMTTEYEANKQSKKEYELASELFMNTFQNPALLRLVPIVTSKEEAKILKVVDIYLSSILSNTVKREVVGFLLNPIPYFQVIRDNPNFDVWAYLEDIESVRQTQAAQSIDKFSKLHKSYSGFPVTSSEKAQEAGTAISNLNSVITYLSDYNRWGDLAKASSLKAHLQDEINRFKEKLNSWGQTLESHKSQLSGLEKSLSNIFREGYPIEDTEVLAAAQLQLGEIEKSMVGINDQAIKAQKEDVKSKLEVVRSCASEKLELYNSYNANLATRVSQLLPTKGWNTQQDVNELQPLATEVNSVIQGRKNLSLEYKEFSGLRRKIELRISDYSQLLNSNMNKLKVINRREQRLQGQLEYKVDPKYAFRVKSGAQILNLTDLLDFLNKGGDQFYSFYTKNQNSFACWIKDILKDDFFAEQLKSAKDYSETVKLVKKRLEQKPLISVDLDYAKRVMKIENIAKKNLSSLDKYRADNALIQLVSQYEDNIKQTLQAYETTIQQIVVSLNKELEEIQVYTDPKNRKYSQDIDRLSGYKQRCIEIQKIFAVIQYQPKDNVIEPLLAKIDTSVVDLQSIYKARQAELSAIYGNVRQQSEEVNAALQGKYEPAIVSRLTEIYQALTTLEFSIDHSYSNDDNLSKKVHSIERLSTKVKETARSRIESTVDSLTDFYNDTLVNINKLSDKPMISSNVRAYQKLRQGMDANRPLYESLLYAKNLEVEHAGTN